MKEQALAFLNSNRLAYIDMIAPIMRGTAEIIAADSRGVLFLEQKSHAHMLAAVNDGEALAFLDLLTEPTLMTIHSIAVATEAARRFGLTLSLTCNQAVWTKPRPPTMPPSPYEIRVLDMTYAEQVNTVYSLNIGPEYIKKRIGNQEMWGAFDGDTLAGFVGCHGEGSMGLLEVLPQYRRQGIGKMLTAFLVGEMLGKGLPAFSQFSIGNEASRQLNLAMGMEISDEVLCWLE